ncbi:hypothetical protein [Kutzneria chonburiensis]|uniref:Uncharacterized protein n=1 Tax=Kutzneria chonburiensis TaxID=1483604 RepID=A0ABV6MPY1_9PSEU|nr:hypothetical protein [Kutzneria chonburiensis]
MDDQGELEGLVALAGEADGLGGVRGLDERADYGAVGLGAGGAELKGDAFGFMAAAVDAVEVAGGDGEAGGGVPDLVGAGGAAGAGVFELAEERGDPGLRDGK